MNVSKKRKKMEKELSAFQRPQHLNPHKWPPDSALVLEAVLGNPLTVPSADLQGSFVAQD